MQGDEPAFISRVVDVPPVEAARIFDLWLKRLFEGDVRELHGSVRFDAGARSGAGGGILRTVEGRLSRGFLSLPVALELAPWTEDSTELGLRLLDGRRPHRRYFAWGHSLLDDLALSLGLLSLQRLSDALSPRAATSAG